MTYDPKITKILTDSFIDITAKIFDRKLEQSSDQTTFDTDEIYSGWIELKSPTTRGVIAVTASTETLFHCHPERKYGDELNAEDLQDWAGEIANRILGLSKSPLASLQITTQLSSPQVSKGDFLGLAGIQSPLMSLNFKNSDHKIKISFQVDILNRSSQTA